MAWLSGFTKRLKVTIPSDNVDSTLTDFPILLKLSTDCGLTGFDASLVFDELELDANRFKIAVTASDGTTQRYVEIEKWDDSAEEAWLWVKVPSIAASGKTELYFYYDSTASDNTTYVGDIGDSAAQNVWTNGFWAVYHLGDTSAPLVDSVVSGTNMTVTGAPTYATPAKVAEGIDWASGQQANRGNPFTGSLITVETWVKQDTAATAIRRYVTVQSEIGVLRQDTGATGRFKWYIKTGGVIRTMIVDGIVDTNWAYWAGTWDGTTQRMYKDGSEIGTPNVPGGSLDTGSGGVQFNSTGENFTGLQDEVRISSVARPESWLKATYYTCNDDLLYMEEDVTEANWLGNWGQRIPLTIDYTQVTSFNEDLLDFPLLVKVSNSSGITNTDLTAFFSELTLSSGTYNKADYYDDFTGTNGDAPDTAKWTETDSTNSMDIQSNKLHFDGGGAGNYTSYVASRFEFDGSSAFDVQIDFDLLTWTSPSSNDNYVRFLIGDGSTYTWMARQQGSGGTTNRMRLYGSGGTNDFAWNWTGTTGKFRFTWDGSSTLKAYVWTGSQWEWNGNTAGYTCSETYVGSAVFVQLLFEQEATGGDVEATFDNFQINSGHVIYDLNRKKVAFTTENGTTQCYAEIDFFDIASEEAWYWVRVPIVHNTENTNLYLYYDSSQADNSTYIGDRGENPAESVWDTNYRTVMHFNQVPTGSASDIKDSSQGNKDGTSINMESSDLISTTIGKGLRFDGKAALGGSDESIDLTDWQDDYITVEAVAKMTYPDPGPYTFMPVFSKDAASPNRSVCLYYQWNGVGGLGISFQASIDGTSTFTGQKANNDYYNTWRYVVGTYDGSYARLYVDDTSAGLSGLNSGTIYNTTTVYEICARSTFSTGWFKGDLAELRVSNITRSGTYIRANYKNLWDSLISYSAPETEPTPSVGTFNGYVKLSGTPVARTVQLYRRSTGELQDSVVSNPNTGYFEVETIYDELHYLVILPELSDGYQPIAQDQIDPV